MISNTHLFPSVCVVACFHVDHCALWKCWGYYIYWWPFRHIAFTSTETVKDGFESHISAPRARQIWAGSLGMGKGMGCFFIQTAPWHTGCVITGWSSLKLPLTHWGRDKMAAIFQTTFSNAFSWMKIYEFWLRFHWSVFLRIQLTIFQHWFR